MTKNNESTVFVPESAPALILDHSSQIGSWTEFDTSTEDAGDNCFVTRLASFEDSVVHERAMMIADEMDRRADREAIDHPDNASIQRNLAKARAALVTKAAARVLLAAGIPASFINRQVHSGSFYNVYALGKLVDLVAGLTDGKLSNAINIHVLKSLFAVIEAGKEFTMETAKACCSKNYIVKEIGVRQHLTRYTVSASTAPTQASSTMQALATLGVVEVWGTNKNPSYSLVDSDLTNRLREVVGA